MFCNRPKTLYEVKGFGRRRWRSLDVMENHRQPARERGSADILWP
jgi:hypothetical protein